MRYWKRLLHEYIFAVSIWRNSLCAAAARTLIDWFSAHEYDDYCDIIDERIIK